jgi:hypothetical protein
LPETALDPKLQATPHLHTRQEPWETRRER